MFLTVCSTFSIGACLYGANHSDILEAANENTRTLNSVFVSHRTVTVDTGHYPVMGGVTANNLTNFTLDLRGVLDFGMCTSPHSAQCAISKDDYPDGTPMFHFTNMSGFRFTSTNHEGAVFGGGGQWYGFADLQVTDQKPVMFSMIGEPSTHVEISHVRFEQSPYWTLYIEADWVTIHHVQIYAKSDDYLMPTVKAFNTDGIDVSGDHVHIFDCVIHVGDDCVAVKGGSHWLVERVDASGLGMSLGAHGVATNITFRDIWMEKTVRAIYIKCEAHDILYQNITVGEASWFPIWVGPAYQFLTGDCPLVWPLVPTAITARVSEAVYGDPLYLNGVCRPSVKSSGTNIRLVDVLVQKSATTPIVMIGNENRYELELTNVRFGETPQSEFPYSNESACENAIVNGASCEYQNCTEHGDRDPVIPCCGEYNPQSGGHWGKCI